MTTAKTAIDHDDSGLVNGGAGSPASVLIPLDELRDYIRMGLMGISSNDTHLGTLEEKLVAGFGIEMTTQNDGADETRTLSVNATTLSRDVVGTAGEDLAIRDMVYLEPSDGKWYKIDIDASATVAMGAIRGCVTEAISTDATGTIRLRGKVGGFTSLTVAARVYGATTAGSFTQTKPTPTTDGAQVVLSDMGFALSATEVFINPRGLRYLKKAELDNDETLTIEHHVDAKAHERTVTVLIDQSTYYTQALVGEWGTALAIFENRFDDGSLSDSTTKTHIKNSTGGTLTVEVAVVF